MVQAFVCKENGVLDEDGARPQDEGEEQVDVNVVPGAAKLPAEETRSHTGRGSACGRGLWTAAPSVST